MSPSVTDNTQCDQVVQSVVAKFAALHQMMYVQVYRRPAILTPPTISFEYPLAKEIVIFEAELQSGTLLAKALHFF